MLQQSHVTVSACQAAARAAGSAREQYGPQCCQPGGLLIGALILLCAVVLLRLLLLLGACLLSCSGALRLLRSSTAASRCTHTMARTGKGFWGARGGRGGGRARGKTHYRQQPQKALQPVEVIAGLCTCTLYQR